MSVVSVTKTEGFTFEIKMPTHTAITDVPVALGGKDLAPSPHEYLETALAACTAITVQMYAQRKAIPLDYTDVKIKITQENKDGNEIHREVSFKGNLTDEQREMLFTIAEKCPVHKFLSTGAKITTTQF